jgi:hypothetical protein
MKKTFLSACWALSVLVLCLPSFSPAASLYLEIPDGRPGGRVIGTLGFEDKEGVDSFRLMLDISSGSILSAAPSDFTRNEKYFPPICVGGQAVNFMENGMAGKISVIGLKPNKTSGSSQVGGIVFKIDDHADTGSVQTVTLSGQIYTNDGNVVSLAPVSKTFTVISFTDTDKDGMDDAWEEFYFGGLEMTGSEDYDFDTIQNLDEYLNGTDPADGIQPGDVNRDNAIDLRDVIASIQTCAGNPQSVCKYADVDGDKKIGLPETVFILRATIEK